MIDDDDDSVGVLITTGAVMAAFPKLTAKRASRLAVYFTTRLNGGTPNEAMVTSNMWTYGVPATERWLAAYCTITGLVYVPWASPADERRSNWPVPPKRQYSPKIRET